MKKLIKYIVFIFFVIVTNKTLSQPVTDIKILDVLPRYYQIIYPNVFKGRLIMVNPRNIIDSTSVGSVRILFKNGDLRNINQIRFDLMIKERRGKKNIILYNIRHTVKLDLLPNEVIMKDIKLKHPISPILHKKFNKKNWGWDAKIISIN